MTYELKFVPSAPKPTPFVHHYITCPHKYLFVRRCLAVHESIRQFLQITLNYPLPILFSFAH